MDELAAHTVAGLILGDDDDNRTMYRPIDNPKTTEPSALRGSGGKREAPVTFKSHSMPRPTRPARRPGVTATSIDPATSTAAPSAARSAARPGPRPTYFNGTAADEPTRHCPSHGRDLRLSAVTSWQVGCADHARGSGWLPRVPVVLLPMRAEVLKGHLDGLLLATLETGPRHGYAVMEAMRSAVGASPTCLPALSIQPSTAWSGPGWSAVVGPPRQADAGAPRRDDRGRAPGLGEREVLVAAFSGAVARPCWRGGHGRRRLLLPPGPGGSPSARRLLG